MVVDAAGNQSSASVNYVVTSFDAAIKITLSLSTVTYPLGTDVVITVAPTHGHVPTGSVQLFDGTTVLQTSSCKEMAPLTSRSRDWQRVRIR
jgi:hypothetical protein